MEYGNTEQFITGFDPVDATEGRNVKWTSSDASVAKVDDNGMVTATGAGKCKILVKSETGSDCGFFTAECNVIVTIPLKGITLDKTDITITKNDTQKLLVGFLPENTTDSKDVTWSSSDISIA